VKEVEMGREFNKDRVKRDAYRMLVGKPEGKRPLGRSRSMSVDNIKNCS
jgi:hypothetical protein